MHPHLRTFPQSQSLTGNKMAHVLHLLLPLQEEFYRFLEVLLIMHPLEALHRSLCIFRDYEENLRSQLKIPLPHLHLLHP